MAEKKMSSPFMSGMKASKGVKKAAKDVAKSDPKMKGKC